jgi:outer membrane receptor for ferrienterochelin and colicins
MRAMPSYHAIEINEDIQPEDAWNFGLNYVWNFKTAPGKNGTIAVDAYTTHFTNQMISDMDTDHTKLSIYNLKGPSYANSLLISYTQDLFKDIEMRLAYKYNRVRTQIGTEIRPALLMPEHRALLHLNYRTPNKKWEFNTTLQATGPQRMPYFHPNQLVEEVPTYRTEQKSPAFLLVNAHVSRNFNKIWNVYIGGENLTNYKQQQPIIGFTNPTGDLSHNHFDASAIYAPVLGIQVYAGIKYTFQGKSRFKIESACESHTIPAPKSFRLKNKVIHGEHSNAIIQTSAQCSMCKNTIIPSVEALNGVLHAQLNLSSGELNIGYDADKITLDKIRKNISKLGYAADDVQAKKGAYNRLPGCCKAE